MRADQQRALTAFRCVAEARAAEGVALADYKGAVHGFAANLLRSGLAVAVTVLERDALRDNGKADGLLREQLHRLHPIGAPAEDWPGAIRRIDDLATYRSLSRQLIAFLGWLSRACRATP